MNDERFNQIEKIIFNKKPISISANYRPFYKISQITLILKLSSRMSKASLLKLHFFSWVLKSNERMAQITEYVDNNFKGKLSLWRIDPLVNRALEFGIAENFFIHKKGKYALANRGKQLSDLILDEDDIFVEEKSFLKEIGKKISETKINSMIDKWKGVD